MELSNISQDWALLQSPRVDQWPLPPYWWRDPGSSRTGGTTWDWSGETCFAAPLGTWARTLSGCTAQWLWRMSAQDPSNEALEDPGPGLLGQTKGCQRAWWYLPNTPPLLGGTQRTRLVWVRSSSLIPKTSMNACNSSFSRRCYSSKIGHWQPCWSLEIVAGVCTGNLGTSWVTADSGRKSLDLWMVTASMSRSDSTGHVPH